MKLAEENVTEALGFTRKHLCIFIKPSVPRQRIQSNRSINCSFRGLFSCSRARAIYRSLRSRKHSELIPVGVGRHLPAGMRIFILLWSRSRVHQELRMQLRAEVRILLRNTTSFIFFSFIHIRIWKLRQGILQN